MIDKIKEEISDYIDNKYYNNYLQSLDKIVTYTKGNIKFYVLLNSLTENKDSNKDLIIKNLNRIHKFSNNAKIDVYLSLSPYKKQFNQDPKKPLSKFNINSAFTYINNYGFPIDKRIFILRIEEFGKVIFHEFIHHIPEIHSTFSNKNIKRLQTHFKIKSIIDPNEAIVEFWATIMFLKQISEETKKDFYKLFKEELNYSLYKSNQLFELQEKNNGIWYDYTNVYCYVIFKTIFMYNLLEFKKIYTFPYNDTIITDFLIKHSILPKIKSNPTTKRPDNSLCFMVNSDDF
jgi:hypothetical protein